MPIGGGFYSTRQKENFATGREVFLRGKASAPICGARTRTGKLCQAVPIKGSCRCIRHCGPKAARSHRERQRAAYLRGTVSVADWHEAEVKRARNRLRERWKRSPWSPGRTLDLGTHEISFAAAVQARPGELCELPPAVSDWLRWKYRRLQIDQRKDGAWDRLLVGELPKRVMLAGPAPQDWSPDTAMPDTTIAVRLDASGEDPAAFSKRQMPDALKPRRAQQVRPVRGRGRPRSAHFTEEEAQAISMTYAENYAMLAPLLDRCASQAEQDAVIRALHDHLHNPDDEATAARWRAMVQKLRS